MREQTNQLCVLRDNSDGDHLGPAGGAEQRIDLKDALDLHCLYASHPNLVAQQVYATALVHAAFRVAQAELAHQSKVLPEQLSPGKLFPKLASAANDYCVCQLHADKVRQLNPGVRIQFPRLRSMPFASTVLASILLERRFPKRKPERRPLDPGRWKSYAHVPGGTELLESASIG